MKTYVPFISGARDDPDNSPIEYITAASYEEGPLCGYARLHGELMFFQEVDRDPVGGDRIYALCRLTRTQRAKAHANRFLWVIELAMNKQAGWPSKRWHKLGRRFSVAKFGDTPVCYTRF